MSGCEGTGKIFSCMFVEKIDFFLLFISDWFVKRDIKIKWEKIYYPCDNFLINLGSLLNKKFPFVV